jgi:lysophospholipase L1-like esterase
MRRILLLPLALSLLHPAVAEEAPRREAAEVRARDGVPHFARKAREAGRGIRVAYLGGSITAAPGWRVKSLEGFKTRFPGAKWSEIHAAIGGTGSDLGVFRLAQDALAHRPDLLFVEFAVNDGGADPARIQRAMEGIVRQTWTADPGTDIVFVYTVSEPFLADLRAGKCSRAATAMEEVADHYGIPSIHFGVEVAKRVDAGTLVFKGEAPDKNTKPDPSAPMLFSTDGVHPLVETGHEIYASVLARSWDAIDTAGAGSSSPRALPGPLRPDHWAAAKLVPLDPSMLKGGWIQPDSGEKGDELARRFSKHLPRLWRAATPGDSLTFRFRGSVIGFFDVVGPDGGQLRVSLDGGETKLVPRFDAYCTYHRLSQFQVGSGLDPAVEHTVTVSLDGTAPDKKSILFEKNRPDLGKNPAKYAPNHWNVGAIMLIGDPLPPAP